MENPSLLRFLVDMRGEDVSNRQVGLGLGLGLSLSLSLSLCPGLSLGISLGLGLGLGLSLSLRLMCKGLLLYTGGVLLHADWYIR